MKWRLPRLLRARASPGRSESNETNAVSATAPFPPIPRVIPDSQGFEYSSCGVAASLAGDEARAGRTAESSVASSKLRGRCPFHFHLGSTMATLLADSRFPIQILLKLPFGGRTVVL